MYRATFDIDTHTLYVTALVCWLLMLLYMLYCVVKSEQQQSHESLDCRTILNGTSKPPVN